MCRSGVLMVLGMSAAAVCGQTWEIFDMNTAGLPSNTVRAIATAPNGDVWVGTEAGLAHYDGIDWEVFQTGSSGLPDNDIRALGVDAENRVWIGSLSGLTSFFDGQWNTFNMQNSDLPEDYVRAIAFSPLGGMWVGTADGLAWFDGTAEWHIYTDQVDSYNGLQLPGMNIASIIVRGDGLVCIGTLNAGFTYLTDTSVTVYTTFQNGLPDNTALGVALDAGGDRWLACPAGGMLNHGGDFFNGVWVQYSTLNSLIPSNSLMCIVVDAWDRKIMGTQGQGMSIHTFPNTFVNYSTQNSDLPGDEVMCLALGAPGSVWVGTSSGGAARLQYAAGVEEVTAGGGLDLFPVPCSNVLNVRYPAPELLSLEVRDVYGRTVLRDRLLNGEHQLDLSGLATGGYMISILDRQGSPIVHTSFTKSN